MIIKFEEVDAVLSYYSILRISFANLRDNFDKVDIIKCINCSHIFFINTIKNSRESN